MQCLFLQHNLIEVIATNAFWECPNLSSLDLSSNKLARLDPSTFSLLNRLMVCELAGNPFHCGCELYSFLTWLEAFNNVTHTYDRLQCETPVEMNGYPLLSPVPGHGKNVRVNLLSMCHDGVIIPGMTSQTPDQDGSGMGLDNPDQGLYHQPNISSTPDPTYSHQISIRLHSVSQYMASLIVQIPRPYSKMFVLSQYNQSFAADIMPLRGKKDLIKVDKLKPHTNYTFCVASIGKSLRYNHTCLSFTTRTFGPEDLRTNSSTMTHYIMTILGCLFGMVVVLGVVYYCLRRRRIQEEKQKAISVKKTILEMRYQMKLHFNHTSKHCKLLLVVDRITHSIYNIMIFFMTILENTYLTLSSALLLCSEVTLFPSGTAQRQLQRWLMIRVQCNVSRSRLTTSTTILEVREANSLHLPPLAQACSIAQPTRRRHGSPLCHRWRKWQLHFPRRWAARATTWM